ncbi:MAG: GntP family permease [Defluviitaleaceae bacterium]|nr:GntP family permease [Defluviitaleaceae bacterium]
MFAIFFGIGLIMFLAYKGWSTIWVAPIASAIVLLLSGIELDQFVHLYRTTYMQGFVGFTLQWFPVFMLGAIFGKLMDSTKMAKAVAVKISQILGPKHAILAVIIAGSVLTYGGVSMFVAVFALYPLALVLFREANIPRRLIPAAITVGVFAYTMVALPGSPQIQNLIPGNFFGTPPTAAPILGIICGAIMVVGGYLYLVWREKQVKLAGEGFTEPPQAVPEDPNEVLPNVLVSLSPLLVVIITLNVFGWDIIVSLITGILLILAVNFQHYKTFIKTINEGAQGSMLPIVNVSAIVGFGTIVQFVPGFTTLVDLLVGIPGTPLLSLAIAVTTVAGATGSASGGLGIALTALADQYIYIAARDGISLEAMHRIAAMASGVMDTVPHNGAILTLLAVCGMTHKESYKDIFVAIIIIPLIATAVGIFLGSLGVV